MFGLLRVPTLGRAPCTWGRQGAGKGVPADGPTGLSGARGSSGCGVRQRPPGGDAAPAGLCTPGTPRPAGAGGRAARPSVLLCFPSLRGASWLQEWGRERSREAAAVLCSECTRRRLGQDSDGSPPRLAPGCFLPFFSEIAPPGFRAPRRPWGRSRPGASGAMVSLQLLVCPEPQPAMPGAKVRWQPPALLLEPDGSWGGDGALVFVASLSLHSWGAEVIIWNGQEKVQPQGGARSRSRGNRLPSGAGRREFGVPGPHLLRAFLAGSSGAPALVLDSH